MLPSLVINKRCLSLILLVLARGTSAHIFFFFLKCFFEVVNLRLYAVKVTRKVQRYEVRNNNPSLV